MPPARFTYMLLLSAIVLSSCEKEDENPATAQHLYTNSGEVKNPSIRNAFIQKAAQLFASPTLPVSPDAKIKFVATDTVVFMPSTMRFSVVQTNDQYLFYSPMIVYTSPDDIFYDLLKYTAPKVFVAGGPSFSSQLTKEVRVAYGDKKQMRLSHLTYRLVQWRNGNKMREAAGILFNEFNPSILAKLNNGDTLAVQESSLMVPIQ